MASEKPDVLLVGQPKPLIINGLSAKFNVHPLANAADKEKLLTDIGASARAIACSVVSENVTREIMAHFPKLEIVSTFGVGYSHVDVAWATSHNVIITNTPDVLTEEVADTALGLLLCTVRELPQAERHVRDGKWLNGDYRLSVATLRDRTVGIVGMGAIGQAIARRLDAFNVPVVYHSRYPAAGVRYRHYPNLVEMARAVDTLMVIVPGGKTTRNLINAEVLEALGSRGIVINMARGSVVDEPALIKALRDRVILSAGLDVFVDEPRIPDELMAMEHVVLLPHVGSASVATRDAMDQIVVDNLLAWVAGKPPLTPVPETPWKG